MNEQNNFQGPTLARERRDSPLGDTNIYCYLWGSDSTLELGWPLPSRLGFENLRIRY